jgi:DNA repair protein RecO (recombination protein O)
MALRNDQGIVLRSYPFGEADRVVVLLSPNRGKMRTVAKGVRKTKSRFGGRLETFCHVDLILYEGRNLDTITQATLIEPFPNLRTDLDRVVMAGTMVEIADTVAGEDEPELRLFLLLQRGLRTLDAGPAHPDFLTSFLLKAAETIGMAPALEHCAGCGRHDDLHLFSFSAGGVLCDRCRTAGAYALRDGLTDYLAAIATGDLADLPEADPRFTGEARGVARRFMEYHLERRIESMAVFDG